MAKRDTYPLQWPHRFRGLKLSAQVERARKLLADYGETLVLNVSPQVMRALDELRGTGYFGGPEPTAETVAEELLRWALRQPGVKDFL